MLKFEAKRAAEGGEHDVGTVILNIGRIGDEYPIFKPSSTPESPIRTTLCELVKESDHFHGEFVELRAEVHPNGADVTPRLLDTSCGANVELHFPDEQSTATGKNLSLLKRYVEQRRVTMATVCGKFELVPVYPGNLTSTLKLVAASDILVTPTVDPGSRKSRR